MLKFVFVLLTLLCCCLHIGICQLYEGEACTTSTGPGVCKLVTSCPQAAANLQKGIHPQVCTFKDKAAIVCCESGSVNSALKECGPIPANASKAQRKGSKAWDKCIDFLQYVFPCENRTIWEPCGNGKQCTRMTFHRRYTCGQVPYSPLRRKRAQVVGGEDSIEKEFPHMALLGFGTSAESAQWLCGGTIVSENYVLTAGHCTFARDNGNVAFVRVGMAQVSSPIDPARLYRISQAIKHPEYKPPNKYHDIALLETAAPIFLDNLVFPACLHTGNAIDDDMMIATGWGLLKYQGASADILQKVGLQKFTNEECLPLVSPSRTLKNGLDPNTQLCAGHREMARDTCQGDSGGPLQIYNQDVSCMYTVVGVTSFGWGCGVIGSPGVYTRVSHYIPWIESVVWP